MEGMIIKYSKEQAEDQGIAHHGVHGKELESTTFPALGPGLFSTKVNLTICKEREHHALRIGHLQTESPAPDYSDK